jgi:ATP phosphoribosyltransferase
VPVKIALPKGRLLRKTAAMLQRAGWDLDEYHSSLGFYRPVSRRFPELLIRVFHEKDIPIQIAMGNYDLGVCCLDWIEELLVKYPSTGIVKVKDLGYGRGVLYMAAADPPPAGKLRIASEYPNLAEAFALKQRLGRFSVFPVWGAAEVYPPENADLVLLSVKDRAELAGCGVTPASRIMDYSAFLIANRLSWESRDLDEVVASICGALPEPEKPLSMAESQVRPLKTERRRRESDAGMVRLALPDGHQQQQTVALLNRAGIRLDDYPSAAGNRRPVIDIKNMTVKVIRPQDMPLQVANGNFDIAVTGRDWLADHLAQFPSSPVREVLDLKLRRVRLVAVVSQSLAAGDAAGLNRLAAGMEGPLRVASEYVNIADKYARDNHLGRYRVIPTWGASEAFLPEDADLLIENTETGRTIARHNLKVIDTLFESTACLIGNAASLADARKSRCIEGFMEKLRKALA